MFEPDAAKSADLLVEHSGGKVAKALLMAVEQGDIQSTQSKDDSIVNDSDAALDESKVVGNPVEEDTSEMTGKKTNAFNCFNNCC